MASDLVEIVEGVDSTGVAAALARHLARPLRRIESGELQSPEEDVIDHVLSKGMDEGQRTRLAEAATMLLHDANFEIATGRSWAGQTRLVGRLGFLCTSLDLRTDARLYHSVARGLWSMQATGVPMDDRDLFLVLRAVGQLPASRQMLLEAATLWLDLLRHPHEGFRTLAAQNLLRLVAAGDDLVPYFASLLAARPNVALLAREWLGLAGSAERLATDAARLAPEARAALEQGLEQVGELGAVSALRLARPFARAAIAPTTVTWLPWCTPPDAAADFPPAPIAPPKPSPIAVAVVAGAIHLSVDRDRGREEVAVIREFFRRSATMPEATLVTRLVAHRQVGRLHLGSG